MNFLRKFLLISSVIVIPLAVYSQIFISREHTHNLPIVRKIPEFSLIDSKGQEFTSRALKGKVWVSDFIFTTCAGICPVMSKHLAGIYESYQGNRHIQFVSFSVNPEYDSPDVLASYAQKYHADPKQWHFLTGKIELIEKIMTEDFKLGSGGEPAMHSGYFVLVDKQGRIRGYYDGTQTDSVEHLKHDIGILLK